MDFWDSKRKKHSYLETLQSSHDYLYKNKAACVLRCKWKGILGCGILQNYIRRWSGHLICDGEIPSISSQTDVYTSNGTASCCPWLPTGTDNKRQPWNPDRHNSLLEWFAYCTMLDKEQREEVKTVRCVSCWRNPWIHKRSELALGPYQRKCSWWRNSWFRCSWLKFKQQVA